MVNIENDDVGMITEVNGGDSQRQRGLVRGPLQLCPIPQGREDHYITIPVALWWYIVSHRGTGLMGKKQYPQK